MTKLKVITEVIDGRPSGCQVAKDEIIRYWRNLMTVENNRSKFFHD